MVLLHGVIIVTAAAAGQRAAARHRAGELFCFFPTTRPRTFSFLT